MNPNDLGEYFSSVATVRLTFVVLDEISKQLQNNLPWNLVHAFMNPAGWKLWLALTSYSLHVNWIGPILDQYIGLWTNTYMTFPSGSAGEGEND